ncbi:MAG: helix-turn-helix domain-containing protein [Isosphaeraceae bacterium]
MPSQLLTVVEVAKYLKCSKSKVYVLISTGKLKHYTLKTDDSPRALIRLAIEDLEDFMKSCYSN